MIVAGENSDLRYELIVGASHMDKQFSFILAPEDAEILEEDFKRQATFRNILYFLLQKKSFGENCVEGQENLQRLFDDVANQVLRSPMSEVDHFVIEQGKWLHIALETYIKNDFDKLSSGSRYTVWGI